MDCPSLNTCPFFNNKMKNMPKVAEMMKKKYCKGNYKECARYIVAQKKGKAAVPIDLFPSQKDKAMQIIG